MKLAQRVARLCSSLSPNPITEAAIFGVNLRLVKPFIGAAIRALGGASVHESIYDRSRGYRYSRIAIVASETYLLYD